ncbi:MAG: sensor histidine kinase [Bacteroidia bacterium]|nr:sensor histidine kinase [Bacteroidia bacterium]
MESHHRIKNQLVRTSAMITLAMDNPQADEFREEVDRIRYKIASLENIHNLLLFREAELNPISGTRRYDVARYFNKIIDALSEVYDQNPGNIHREILPAEIRPPGTYFLGLILHELVNNAFKYACCKDRPLHLKIEFLKRKTIICCGLRIMAPASRQPWSKKASSTWATFKTGA